MAGRSAGTSAPGHLNHYDSATARVAHIGLGDQPFEVVREYALQASTHSSQGNGCVKKPNQFPGKVVRHARSTSQKGNGLRAARRR